MLINRGRLDKIIYIINIAMGYFAKGFVETLIVGVISLILWGGLNTYFLPDLRSGSPSRDTIFVFSMVTLAIAPLAVFFERFRRMHKISPLGLGSIVSACIGAGLAMLIIFYLAAIMAWQ